MSLRKVAAELGVGPMRLYGYLETKEELLDLMVDSSRKIQPSGEGRREVLRSLAEATRQAVHRHEWLADLLGGRPQLGPNALARLEAVVAGLRGVDADAVLPVVAAVDSYVIGAVRREIAERRAEQAPEPASLGVPGGRAREEPLVEAADLAPGDEDDVGPGGAESFRALSQRPEHGGGQHARLTQHRGAQERFRHREAVHEQSRVGA